MFKEDARKYFIEKRAALTAQDRMKKDDLLLIQLQTVTLPSVTFLFSYWPLEEKQEPNTLLFTDYLEFKNPGIVLCYPKTDFNSLSMQAIQTNDDTRFRRNKYGIYEPENGDSVNAAGIDMVFVPLIAADKKGYRVGYGKGFYDRYLAHCRADCMKIGFSYFEPVDAIEDSHDFDVPLDLCVTPDSVYVF